MKKKTKRFLALLAAGTICLPVVDRGLTSLREQWQKRNEKHAELQAKKDNIVAALKVHNNVHESDELPKTPAQTDSFIHIYGTSVPTAREKVHDAILANAARW